MKKVNKINQEIAATINRKIVLGFIKEKNVTNRKEIINHTKLSASTVTYIVNELKKNNYIIEFPAEKGVQKGAGNKPLILKLNSKQNWFIGLDINSVSSVVCGLDFGDNLLFSEDTKYKFTEVNNLETDIIKVIEKQIEKYFDKKLHGIGISFSGIVNNSKSKIIYSHEYNIKNFKISDTIKKYFKIPVFIENNANAAAFGEFYLVLRKKIKNLIFLHFMDRNIGERLEISGIGLGIIIDKHIYYGENSAAGEINDLIFKSKTIKKLLKQNDIIKTDYNILGKDIGLVVSILVNALEPAVVVVGETRFLTGEEKLEFFNTIRDSILESKLPYIKTKINKSFFNNISSAIGSAALVSNAFFESKKFF